VPQPARSFRLRRARRADIAGLLALENASFATDRMSARQLRRHIDSSSAEFLVATDDAQVLGAALVFLRRRSAVARLYSIAVADAARGLGLGTRLLEVAERRAQRRGARAMRLEVRSDNHAARRLYEANGYRRIASLPSYYEDGADGARYERELRERDGQVE
jgi:ribosomal-protein-alanine acetyltransferase